MNTNTPGYASSVAKRLKDSGFTPSLIAAGAQLKRGTVYNLLSGNNASQMGRQRITNYCGIELWPGIVPTRDAMPASTRTLADEALIRIEAALQPHLPAKTEDESITRVSSALAIIHEPGVKAVLEDVLKCRHGLGLLVKAGPLLVPFFEEITGNPLRMTKADNGQITVKLSKSRVLPPASFAQDASNTPSSQTHQRHR